MGITVHVCNPSQTVELTLPEDNPARVPPLKESRYKEIESNLTPGERLAFKQDFVFDDNIKYEAVCRILYEGLLDAWKHCNKNGIKSAWKSDFSYLKSYKFFFDRIERIRSHLLGEINGTGNAVGAHIQKAFIGNKVVPDFEKSIPKYWDEAELDYKQLHIKILDDNGKYVKKLSKSTVFPKGWDEQKVLEEMTYIKRYGTQLTERKWQGYSSEGEIELLVKLKGIDIDEFDTVYPIID